MSLSTQSTLQKAICEIVPWANLKVVLAIKNRLSSKLFFANIISEEIFFIICEKFHSISSTTIWYLVAARQRRSFCIYWQNKAKNYVGLDHVLICNTGCLIMIMQLLLFSFGVKVISISIKNIFVKQKCTQRWWMWEIWNVIYKYSIWRENLANFSLALLIKHIAMLHKNNF